MEATLSSAKSKGLHPRFNERSATDRLAKSGELIRDFFLFFPFFIRIPSLFSRESDIWAVIRDSRGNFKVEWTVEISRLLFHSTRFGSEEGGMFYARVGWTLIREEILNCKGSLGALVRKGWKSWCEKDSRDTKFEEFAFFVQEEFLQSRVEGNSFCPIPSIDAFFSFSFPIRRNEKNFRILRIVPWFLPPAIVISFKSILRFHRRLTRTRNIHAKIPLIRYFRVSPCRRWLMRKNIK